MPKWTDSQKKAIDIRNTNVLVSAAAGSGKTAVLVQRVINMITDEKNPVYVNELLISTFTKAAAAEMRERIYSALRTEIAKRPESKHLRRQLTLLNQAQISTIHSFCANLLRENFHKTKLRHDFKIADESRLAALRNEAINEVLDKRYSEGNAEFLETVDTFGGKKSDDSLIEIVLNLYFFADSFAHPNEWLLSCCDYENNMPLYKKYINEYVKETLFAVAERYKTALDTIYTDPGLEPYKDIYESENDTFLYLAENLDKDVSKDFAAFEFSKLPRKKKEADEVNAKFVQKVRDYAKKHFPSLASLYLYNDGEIAEEAEKMMPYVKTICSVTEEFSKVYGRLKREENIVDFSDLEHFTVALLEENDDVCEELRVKYKEIFIDEYQDTNGVQAFLFEKISNGNNLFMVGDVKQSIYGFRNSNPKYFVGKYNAFSADPNVNGQDILLSHNFRSSNGVLSFINNIFEGLMSKKVGDVDYNDEHRLIYANHDVSDLDKSSEIHLIECANSGTEEESFADNTETEALFAARRILDLVENEKPEIYDKSLGKHRPVKYGDIALLLRKTKDVASVFANVFSARGIPVYTEETGSYFNNIEVATVMSFLQVVENPLQDIPLLAVMRSPLYGFDDNLIAKIRSENRYDFLYNLLKRSDEPKAKRLINELGKLCEYAKYSSADSVVRKIVYDTGYYQFVGGLTNGARRMANLSLLCERAAGFCSGGFKDVFKFIEYIKNMIETGKEYSSAKMSGENDDAVTITTIHKSKGLEFPIVILADCSRSFNVTDFSKSYIYDEDLGFAVNVVESTRHLRYVPYIKKAVAEKKKGDLWSEEARLLYVAMTRAKYKLIVTAAVKDTSFTVNEAASAGINPYAFKGQNCYIKWILTALGGKGATFHSRAGVISNDRCALAVENEFTRNTDYSEFYEEIDKRLSYVYPYENCKNIPSKRSISEIAEDGNEIIHLNEIKDISGSLTAAQRGTVIHFVLQNINLSDVGSAKSIKSQLDKMVFDEMLDKEYAEIADCEAMYGFFSSEIGKRMLASEKIYREFRFCVDLPADKVGFENCGETVLIQGVIDCCFLEDGEFVIIDYKTGSLQEKYKKQLELYALCLSAATGKKVKETCIYPLI